MPTPTDPGGTTVPPSDWTAPPRIPRRAHAALLLLFPFQTSNFFGRLVFGLSAVPLMAELHIGPAKFGWIGGSFVLLFSLSGVLIGLFGIGRTPIEGLLLALAPPWSAAKLPIFFTHSVVVLVLCRILLGLGEGPGLPGARHACCDWFPPHRRGLPSAVILQGISAGLLVGGPILTAVIDAEGRRALFLVCGLFGLIWAGVWIAIGAEGPFAAEQPATGPGAAGLFAGAAAAFALMCPKRSITARDRREATPGRSRVGAHPARR